MKRFSFGAYWSFHFTRYSYGCSSSFTTCFIGFHRKIFTLSSRFTSRGKKGGEKSSHIATWSLLPLATDNETHTYYNHIKFQLFALLCFALHRSNLGYTTDEEGSFHEQNWFLFALYCFVFSFATARSSFKAWIEFEESSESTTSASILRLASLNFQN